MHGNFLKNGSRTAASYARFQVNGRAVDKKFPMMGYHREQSHIFGMSDAIYAGAPLANCEKERYTTGHSVPF
jgi:hypothetical protein